MSYFFCILLIFCDTIIKNNEVCIMKRFLSIITIISSCIVAALLILWLFDMKILGDNNTKVIITFIVLSIGGLFSLNSVSMLKKNKVLGLVSFILILISVVLITLTMWITIDSDLYFKITISVGLLSILFNIIVSTGLNLGRKYLVFQIITYIIVFAICLMTVLMFFGALNILTILPLYLTLIIIAILGVILLKVFASKIKSAIIPI